MYRDKTVSWMKRFGNQMREWSFFLSLTLLVAGPPCLAQASQFADGYQLPPESIQDILRRDAHYDTLTNLSPDKKHLLIPVNAEFSTLERMAMKTYRLGMLEINPEVNRELRLTNYGLRGLKIYSLDERTSRDVRLPSNALISDIVWSPDGAQIAFLAHEDQGSRVWTADVATGEARSLGDSSVMATLSAQRRRFGGGSAPPSSMLQWLPDGSILTLIVPPNRGPEPEEAGVPESPIIRKTPDKPSPTPTFPFLLRTPHDLELFRYYTTAQLAALRQGQAPRHIGQPAQYESIFLSPDGSHVLAEVLVDNYSYIVSYTNFPRESRIMDMQGTSLSTIRKTSLHETSVRGRGSDPAEDLPRDIVWRPDGRGVSFLWREEKKKEEGSTEKEDSKEDNKDARRGDRLMLLAPPFDMAQVQILLTSESKLDNLSYSENGRYAFVSTTPRDEKKQIQAYDLTQTPPQKHVLVSDIDADDATKQPGDILTDRTSNGVEFAVLSPDGSSAYLRSDGFKESFQPQPFIDRVNIQSGSVNRAFESSAEMLERPLHPLDAEMSRIVISRESKTVFPDSYLWQADGKATRLTNNHDPFPEVANCERIDFNFTRRDGLTVYARITLPVGYQRGTRVPAVFWTYPREFENFKKYKDAAIRSRTNNEFSILDYRNASEIWLTQGYAVVVPDIPIIGKKDSYNNNYITHLVDSMYGAIRKVDQLGYVDVDRMGHGGHSYGAFATANILAHSPFFKAGIAGDGAYNRSLTPMTFQNEPRFLWEATDTILEMSPFFYADHIDTPLLMYHGAADNNTGTFLIQSERMMQALTGLGKKAALYIYPYESHGPRAIETYLDLWSRWLGWFDKYVKEQKTEEVTEEGSQ